MAAECTCAGYYEKREGYIVIATRPGCPEHDPDHKRGALGQPCDAHGKPLSA